MTSPLPKLPSNPLPELDLPDNPLGPAPSAPIVGKGGPLRFPFERRRGTGGHGGGRAPLPSLTSLARPNPNRPPTQPGAPRIQRQRPKRPNLTRRESPAVVIQPQIKPLPTPPVAPVVVNRTPGGRVSAEGKRQAVDDLLGKRTGRFYRGMTAENRRAFSVLMSEHGYDERHAVERATHAEIRGRIAELRDRRAYEKAKQAEVDALKRQKKAQGVPLERTDLGGGES